MRITCPECEKVLRPAAPIAPGKKVKCPQCGTTFAVVDTGGDDDDEPKKSKAVTTKATEATKAAAKAEIKPDKPAAGAADDDEEGGTYGIQASPEEEEEAKEEKGKIKAKDRGKGKDGKKPQIDYAPDTSIKDLRGPAQAAVIKPTNFLIGFGVVGFIGWIALLVLLSIPVLFPVEVDEGTKDFPKAVLRIGPGLGPNFGKVGEDFMPPGPPPKPKDSNEKENVSLYEFLGYDYRQLAQYAWYQFILMVSPIYFGMAYSAIQTFGAVRAQNLESREWGVASSIMAMIPVNMAGAAWFVGMFASFVLNMVLDDMEMIDNVIYGIFAVLGLASIAIGVYLIMTLMQPPVIAGFEFVPDSDDVNPGKKDKDKDKDKDDDEDKPRRKKRS